ncbi:hypothetical protein [uncultured Erythrobacter sp.]|uniref:COG3650 family protein n=1 Tax=uncultured Erythrobacter sp. TaxID=263913 RepID=UPI00261581AA|nr:hypothetical protein [uncultured Erythrobacter sp.]
MIARFAKCSGVAAAILLAGCAQGDSISNNPEPYDGIAEDETLHLLGTEPFWSFEISGEAAEFTSPEDLDGVGITVTRFAGNNGLGYSGELKDEPLQIAITPGDCSDGMSDRSYPFTATISWGEATLLGCGYTDSQPFTGEEAS